MNTSPSLFFAIFAFLLLGGCHTPTIFNEVSLQPLYSLSEATCHSSVKHTQNETAQKTAITREVWYNNKMYSFSFFVNIDTTDAGYSLIDWNGGAKYPMPSEDFISSIDIMKDSIEELPIREQLDFLLALCQQQRHIDDRLLYGQERYFSPERTIAAKESDCDDKSILFSFLVWEILKLESILIIYPQAQHVNVGLDYIDGRGKYVYHNDKKYLVCEPSSLWTRSGEQMKFIESSDNEILTLPVYHPHQ